MNLSLVADFGGTHARFAMFDGRELIEPVRLRASEFEQPAEAALHYLLSLRQHRQPEMPQQAVFAVASPVAGDLVEMTNSMWRFSVEQTRRDLGLEGLLLINDFAALSLALPHLGSRDCRVIREGVAVPTAARALIGPGTGLGVGGLLPCANGGWCVVEGEGGHRDLCPSTAREWAVFQVLGRRWNHISAERVLSGPGLVALYQALAALDDVEPRTDEAAQIVERAGAGTDVLAQETVRVFSAWLGAVTGDLALVLGAKGGVFLGGGMLERMGDVFATDLFLERFLAKGRMSSFMTSIPVHLVVNPWASLLGATKRLAH